jgi:hypothetical protein
MNKISLLFLLMLFLALPGGLTQAQARYDWMPKGGCEILMSLNRGDLLEIVTAERTGVDSSMEEWKQVEIIFAIFQKLSPPVSIPPCYCLPLSFPPSRSPTNHPCSVTLEFRIPPSASNRTSPGLESDLPVVQEIASIKTTNLFYS